MTFSIVFLHHILLFLLIPFPTSSSSLPFSYIPYDSMVSRMQSFASTFPQFVEVHTSQDVYGLPTVGTCGQSTSACHNYFMVIQDRLHSLGSLMDTKLVEDEGDDRQGATHVPDVFFSGEVHGDETVGPLAVFHTAELLLTASACSATYYETSTPTNGSNEYCAKWFDEWGYKEGELIWLSGLVASRRIIISPMSNPSGFSATLRSENNIDPNRDFAFDVTSPSLCMRTVTGRHINSLYRSSIIQAGITFHGGMTAVAYEWGAPSYKHRGKVSPDNGAQKVIGKGMSDYGGTFTTEIKYPYAPMNDIVYPVHGGMEDWAYASSWSPKVVSGGCDPSTYGGYDKALTKYNDGVLRSLTILVEASKIKRPSKKNLGGYTEIFNPSSVNNGHVPRNVRLTLLISDIVEPWINVESVNDVAVVDRDRIPGIGRSSTSCFDRNKVILQPGETALKIKWSVWGSVEVDATNVLVVERKEGDGLSCGLKYWTSEGEGSSVVLKSKSGLRNVTAMSSDSQKGEGRWAKASDPAFVGKQFEETLNLKEMGLEGKNIAIIVRAKVDKAWGMEKELTGALFDGSENPESHVVNARTNTGWRKENAGKVVEGRDEWFSGILSVEWGTGDGGGVKDGGIIGSKATFDPSMITIPFGEGFDVGGGGGGGDDGGGDDGTKPNDNTVENIPDEEASRFDIILMPMGLVALFGILYKIKNSKNKSPGNGAVEIEGFEMQKGRTANEADVV
mmetsp:Transcript_23050/g.47782  ORF Transcript_23050/g.47782 Transcript_23050/m.47782 type:complete len:733 (+) Transcript_23050:188-2386(+)